MADYVYGIYNTRTEQWYPFGYDHPRLAKPHPCFTSPCPQLAAIVEELRKRDKSWRLRLATKAERDYPKIADVRDDMVPVEPTLWGQNHHEND